MFNRLLAALGAVLLSTSMGPAQRTARPGAAGDDAVAGLAKHLGAAGLKSIQYSGSGSNFAVGQSFRPGAAWPRFVVRSYSRLINYETVAHREELVAIQGEDPPRGGGGQPLVGERRQIQFVSGGHAWNLAGNTATPAPAALSERLLQIWITPHGFVRAAQANKATVKSELVGKKRMTVISFKGHGKYTVTGYVNQQNLLERVESSLPNPVLGDMPVEAIYSDYKEFGNVKFPTRIVQKQGGFPSLDLTIASVEPNAAANIETPDNVKQAQAPPVRVEAQKIADGIWYVTGGSHHSAVVEFKDHVAVIEGPLNDDRSSAVKAKVKELAPNKPIKYLINTHHHFDHSGGLGAYAADGVTIITHMINKPFYERVFRNPRTLSPDLLSQSKNPLKIMAVGAKYVLSDGQRTLELHHIKGNTHNEAIIMAYLPKEKIMIEADVFTPPAPNAPAPVSPNPFSVNLYENIQRLKLDVKQIAPLHGRLVNLSELEKAVGKTS